MPDQFIAVPPDSTGKKVDTSELNVGANVVQRQRHNIADPVTAAAIMGVKAAAPGVNDYGAVVRPVVTDGYDANAGATTDVAVVADVNGSMSGKLRGIVKMLADMWNGALHALSVNVVGTLPAGANIIGKVGIDAAANTVILGAGANNVGAVSFQAGQTVGLAAGVQTIGAVGLVAGQTLAAVTAITNALPVGANIIGKVGIDAAANTVILGAGANNIGAVSFQAGQTVGLAAGAQNIGAVSLQAGQTLAAVTAITNALPVGANIIGKVGIDAANTGGLALEAGNIATILGRTPALGGAAAAASVPVALASDQVQSKSTQPNDNDLGVLVRQIGEDNSYTQSLLNQLCGLLFKVFNMTAAAGTPALNVLAIQPTAANLNATLAANSTMSVSQVSAVAVANVTGVQAPSMTTQTAALTVAPSQSYHPPVIPMHIYDPGAIIV